MFKDCRPTFIFVNIINGYVNIMNGLDALTVNGDESFPTVKTRMKMHNCLLAVL